MIEFLRTWESPSLGWRLIKLQGKDSADFLDRLTTIDPAKVSPSQALPGFLLNGKAQILSAFFVSRLSETEFALELDPGKDDWFLSQTLKALDDMHFGEEISFEPTDLACLWSFGDGAAEGRPADHVISGELFDRSWKRFWGKPSDLDSISKKAKAISEEMFNKRRIDHLVPWVDHEYSEKEANPLELGQQLGIDRNKGCYPGQEVIEKIYTYGAPSKRLVRFSSGDPAKQGTVVQAEGNSVGWVSTSSIDGKGLALVKKNSANEATTLKLENGTQITIDKVSDYGKEN